jgi:hypothetical protein
MKSFDSDLKKYADKIRLKAAERAVLRERILSYMEYHPLPKQSGEYAAMPILLESQPFTMIRVTRRTMQLAAGFFALTLIVLPFAAERSVPGDVLYLVKTGVNESVRGQLVSTPYEKIEFETKLIERRISEARSLATQGKLTDDVKTQLAATVKEHTKSVTSNITALGAQDADGAAIARIAFSSSLEVQSAVLNASPESGQESTSVDSLLTVVNEARSEASVAAEGEPAPSYAGLLAKVELETTRAYELFETVKHSATTQEIQNIERRLNDVNRLIGESKDAYNQPAETDVTLRMASTEVAQTPRKLASTLSLLNKLIVFMTDIDVRETVELETIVPVVLSDEERLVAVASELNVLIERTTPITGALEELTDEDIAEKVSLGLTRIEELSLQARSAVEASDALLAETSLREMSALISDLDALVSKPLPSPEDLVPEEDGELEVEELVATSTDTIVDTDRGSTTLPTRE